MAVSGKDGSLEILLEYDSNLADVAKEHNAIIRKLETKLKNNNKYLEDAAQKQGKLRKQTIEAINRRKEENTIIKKKLSLLEKQAKTQTQSGDLQLKLLRKIVQNTSHLAKIETGINKTLKEKLVIQKSITKESKKQTDEAKEAKRLSEKDKRKKAANSFGGAFDPDYSTSFGHKLGTTAQYIAAGAGIMGLAQAAASLGRNVVQTDLSMRTMAAVLEINVSKARVLSKEVHKLGETYGGSLEEIDAVALALGRAGIAQEDMVKGTEIVLQMARLTGDTFEQSASAIVSFQQVFGDTTPIEKLGNKLAYIANVSRLSTQDIGTFANYALAAAKNVGLTEDAVGGLAAAFSNAGVNASTIGTQIRRFTTLLTDNSTSVNNFFEGLGVNQGKLLVQLQRGGAESNKAILEFVNTLNSVNDVDFTRLIGGMDILASNSLSLMRNNADNINKFTNQLETGVSTQLENTKVILDSYLVTYEASWNKFLNMTENSLNKFINGWSDIFSAQRSLFNRVIGDDVMADNVDRALRLKKVQEEIAQIAKDEREGIISKSDAQYLLIELKTQELDLTKELSNKKASEVDNQAKLNALKESKSGIESQIDELKAKKELESIDKSRLKVLEEYSKELDKKIKLEEKASNPTTITKTQGLRVQDLSTNLITAIRAGTSTDKQIAEFNDALEREKNKIKGVIEDQLKNLDKETRDLYENKFQGFGLVNGLKGLADSIDTEYKTASEGRKKVLEESKPVVNKLIELEGRLNNAKREGDKVTGAQNAKTEDLLRKEQRRLDIAERIAVLEAQIGNKDVKASELAKIRLDYANKAWINAKGRKVEDEKYVKLLQAQLDYKKAISADEAKRVKAEEKLEELRQSSLLLEAQIQNKTVKASELAQDKLEFAVKAWVKAKDTKNEEEKYNELLKAQLEYKKAITSEESKRIKKQKKALDDARKLHLEELNFKMKLRELDRKDYRGVGVSRATEVMNIQDRLGDTRARIEDAKAIEDKLARTKELNRLRLTERDLVNELTVAQDRLNNAFVSGGVDALEKYSNAAMDTYSQINSIVTSSLNGAEQAFMDFITTGKAGFKDLVNSILQDLLRMQIRKNILGPLSGVISSALPTMFANANGNAFSNGSVQKFAKGGTFTNSIVNSPTYFPMNGKTGLMGEAGPEAIVPLKRDSQGSLGVKSAPSNVILNIKNESGSPIEEEMIEEFTRTNERGEEEKVVSIVLKRLQTDSGFRNAIRGR